MMIIDDDNDNDAVSPDRLTPEQDSFPTWVPQMGLDV